MENIEIDYQSLLQKNLFGVIKDVLLLTDQLGYLPGKHHFYFEIKSKFPGVLLPQELLLKYPENITLVIQHEYCELKVDDEQISVTLSFNGKQEKIIIPFLSINKFIDPSVPFSLDFTQFAKKDFTPQKTAFDNSKNSKSSNSKSSTTKSSNKKPEATTPDDKTTSKNNVLKFDPSRKK